MWDRCRTIPVCGNPLTATKQHLCPGMPSFSPRNLMNKPQSLVSRTDSLDVDSPTVLACGQSLALCLIKNPTRTQLVTNLPPSQKPVHFGAHLLRATDSNIDFPIPPACVPWSLLQVVTTIKANDQWQIQ